MIWQQLKNFSNSPAVISEAGMQYTYESFNREAEQLAAHLPDDRCLIFSLCLNEIGSLLGYVTFMNSRKVPLLLDAHLDHALLLSLINHYKPDYLWIPSIMVHRFGYEEQYSAKNYHLLKTPYTRAYPLYEELALLLTTSGSTGSPKLVRQSYANIKANTKSIVEYLALDHTERPITTLPMSYTYGLSIINSHLYVGASIILTQKSILQKEFWQQFKDYAATSFGGVPYTYEMLDKLRFTRMQLPSLKTMTQAGGKLSPELHKKFAQYAKETGRQFIVMYGQTEATARMSYLPHDQSLNKYGSMGIAIPGGEFFLIDGDGNEIGEPEIVGELVYKGLNVTLGYAECGEDLFKGDERHGVLITGDMAKRDSDGYYYIVGRKKRFLKLFGSRVNLDETERLAQSMFPDAGCACGGIDDKLYVFITDAGKKDVIKKFLAEKMGVHSSAFEMVVMEQIPRNDSGKVLYNELARYYHG